MSRATFRPMAPEERALCLALARCRFAPATFDKRFARDVGAQAAAEEPRITDRQAALLPKLAWRYRKQLAAMGVPTPTVKPPEPKLEQPVSQVAKEVVRVRSSERDRRHRELEEKLARLREGHW